VDQQPHATETSVTPDGADQSSAVARQGAHDEVDEIGARVGEIVATSRALAVEHAPPVEEPSKHILLGPALASPEGFQSRLGRMLIERHLITKEELDRALVRQSETGERLGEALVSMGAVSSGDAARVLAEHLRLPFVDLGDDVSDRSVLGAISPEIARRYVALPVARWGNRIVIAMANPNDSDMVDELRLLVKAPVVVAATDPVALRSMIATVYGSSKTPVAEPVSATPDSDPIATITFTCPGCQQELHLRAAPWVMTEVNRDPGRYYVWDFEPGVAGPAHICGRTENPLARRAPYRPSVIASDDASAGVEPTSR
jgi:type II secretion system (T2SS) protein E